MIIPFNYNNVLFLNISRKYFAFHFDSKVAAVRRHDQLYALGYQNSRFLVLAVNSLHNALLSKNALSTKIKFFEMFIHFVHIFNQNIHVVSI